jgi:hypothetical protein
MTKGKGSGTSQAGERHPDEKKNRGNGMEGIAFSGAKKGTLLGL